MLLYSLPTAADTYLHLAGRTGRQGRSGVVVSLLCPWEAGEVGRITRQLGLSIKQHPAISLRLDDERRARDARRGAAEGEAGAAVGAA